MKPGKLVEPGPPVKTGRPDRYKTPATPDWPAEADLPDGTGNPDLSGGPASCVELAPTSLEGMLATPTLPSGATKPELEETGVPDPPEALAAWRLAPGWLDELATPNLAGERGSSQGRTPDPRDEGEDSAAGAAESGSS